MADILTVSQILNVAKLAQALAQNDASVKKALSGASLDDDLGAKIYVERMAVQTRFALDSSDATLRDTSNHLFAICGNFGLQALNILSQQTAGAPVVTGPSNQTVNVGGTASFTISVTSTLLFSIAWYKNGALVSGQTGTTYSFTAQQSDNGAIVNAIVTNNVGSASSANASLTVSNTLVGSVYYTPDGNDPYATIAGGTDPFSYQVNISIVHNQPVSFTMPSGSANNQYLVFRIPIGETVYNHYQNGSFIQGNFTSDFNFHDPITITALGFRYYISRQALSIDVTQPFTLSTI